MPTKEQFPYQYHPRETIPDVPEIYDYLRQQNPGLHGQLDSALLPTLEAAQLGLKSIALCGMKNLWKHIAIERYMVSRRGNFDAILWIDGESSTSLFEDFFKIYEQLGLQIDFKDQSIPVKDDYVKAVKAWFSHPVKDSKDTEAGQAKWMIIFDNATSPEILKNWWPEGSNGTIIITSSDPRFQMQPWSTSEGVDLNPLPADVGGNLLLFMKKSFDAYYSRELNGYQNVSELMDFERGGKELCESLSRVLGGIPHALLEMSKAELGKWRHAKRLLESETMDAQARASFSKSGIEEIYRIHGVCWDIGNAFEEEDYIKLLNQIVDLRRERILEDYFYRDECKDQENLPRLTNQPLVEVKSGKARAQEYRPSVVHTNPDSVAPLGKFMTKKLGDGRKWTKSEYEAAREELVSRSLAKVNQVGVLGSELHVPWIV